MTCCLTNRRRRISGTDEKPETPTKECQIELKTIADSFDGKYVEKSPQEDEKKCNTALDPQGKV